MAKGNIPLALFTIQVTKFLPFISAVPNKFWVGQAECKYVIVWPGHPVPIRPKESKHGHKYPVFSDGNVTLHVGHYQKPDTLTEDPRIPTTIRLGDPDDKKRVPHAVLQFDIADENGKPGPYYPVGVAFWRADGTPPIGTPFSTGAQTMTKKINGLKEDSPFSKMKFNDPFRRVEFDVKAISRLRSTQAVPKFERTKAHFKGTHRTYRFIIFIQELETGDIGVIDPEIEPPV